jgi:hypothetical protein
LLLYVIFLFGEADITIKKSVGKGVEFVEKHQAIYISIIVIISRDIIV